jgi:NAD/NADP transhydrogenase beta subunit
MLELLKKLIGLVPGGGVAGAVSNVATLGAVIAAIAGPAAWLFAERDTVFISITIGELAFWGSVVAVIYWLALVVARRAPPP